MKKIAILGSTGSIGTQTLDIVREQGDIQVVAMAAGSNISLLEAQMREFKPSLVSVWNAKKGIRTSYEYKRPRHKNRVRHGRTS